MSYVIVSRYAEEQEKDELLDRYLEGKVERYKQQDRKRNSDTYSYIIVEQFVSKTYGSS